MRTVSPEGRVSLCPVSCSRAPNSTPVKAVRRAVAERTLRQWFRFAFQRRSNLTKGIEKAIDVTPPCAKG